MNDQSWMLRIIERIEIGDGKLSIELKAGRLAGQLQIAVESIDASTLTFDIPFTMRRRGVEARFLMGGEASRQGTSLIANIARAYHWLDQIKAGMMLDQIAANEITTKKRVQQTLNHVFLAPDIMRDILGGNQPTGLTSTWIATHDLPINWDDQRSLISTL